MQKVYVGLSGGVDSAVSAALLLQRHGYDVTGAFIKIWQPEFIECTWREDRLDTIRVCAALGIPFREIDLSAEYKKDVVSNMIENYARGVTPNPDVLCNQSIKFGSFKKWAFSEGADFIATGHYAQTKEGRLLRGKDASKDQSYFLYRVSSDDLAKTLFPVGGYTKREIRTLAKKFGLPNADKPDSQGLCFVGDVTMKDFLARFISLKQGSVVDTNEREIGTHDGAALYTIGQRHGFTTISNVTHYVVGIDPKSNIVKVSEHRHDAERLDLELRDVHWIGEKPHHAFDADVEARYRETPVRARIKIDNTITVHFEKPHLASPGQSLVIYHGDECLGGGMIQ